MYGSCTTLNMSTPVGTKYLAPPPPSSSLPTATGCVSRGRMPPDLSTRGCMAATAAGRCSNPRSSLGRSRT